MMDTPNQLAMALEGRYRLIERLKSEDCRTIIKGQDVELDPGRSWDEDDLPLTRTHLQIAVRSSTVPDLPPTDHPPQIPSGMGWVYTAMVKALAPANVVAYICNRARDYAEDRAGEDPWAYEQWAACDLVTWWVGDASEVFGVVGVILPDLLQIPGIDPPPAAELDPPSFLLRSGCLLPDQIEALTRLSANSAELLADLGGEPHPWHRAVLAWRETLKDRYTCKAWEEKIGPHFEGHLDASQVRSLELVTALAPRQVRVEADAKVRALLADGEDPRNAMCATMLRVCYDLAEMDCLDGDTLIPGIALAKALTGDASARHMLIRNECGWLVDPSEYFPSDGVLAAAWDEVVNEGGEND